MNAVVRRRPGWLRGRWRRPPRTRCLRQTLCSASQADTCARIRSRAAPSDNVYQPDSRSCVPAREGDARSSPWNRGRAPVDVAGSNSTLHRASSASTPSMLSVTRAGSGARVPCACSTSTSLTKLSSRSARVSPTKVMVVSSWIAMSMRRSITERPSRSAQAYDHEGGRRTPPAAAHERRGTPGLVNIRARATPNAALRVRLPQRRR